MRALWKTKAQGKMNDSHQPATAVHIKAWENAHQFLVESQNKKVYSYKVVEQRYTEDDGNDTLEVTITFYEP